MNLSSPITINPADIHLANGEVRPMKPVTLTELEVTVIDNATRKSCVAQIRPCPQPIVLWEGEDYDAAGDYTQAQVEARILELLGNDPKSVLEKLFVSSKA